MSNVKISLVGLKKLQKDMPKLLDKVERLVASDAPKNIVSNVRKGLTGIFPTNSLPYNQPSTQARKGHGRRLEDTGALLTTGNWSVSKSTKGYLVRPPSNRGDVVNYLNTPNGSRPAYKIMEIPKGYFPNWASVISKTFFNMVIPRYN